MNTKLAKALIGATNPQLNLDELDFYAGDIVQTNNHATQYGFSDLPMLDYHGVEYEDNKIIVSVRPKCGKVELTDLYNLKQAWGADSIEVMTTENPAICIIFNTK